MLLPERFERIARANPQAIALSFPPSPTQPSRRDFHYGDLLARSLALAERLRGVPRPGSDDAIVVIAIGRDQPELYIAQLAVMQAAAAFACIDPALPDDAIRMVLDDARPMAILTDREGRARWTELLANGSAAAHPPLLMDATERGPGDIDRPVPAEARGGEAIRGSDLAYLIYTSGTTGRPKGVMIEHRSIAHLIASDVARFGLGPQDRVAQCSAPAYDSSLEETWLAFAVGATLVPLDDATVRLGPDLIPWLRREAITVLCPPPTLLRATGCDDPATELPHLRLLYVGGEALPQDLADRWARGRWMENGYGPTECTVTVVRGRIEPGVPVTIGQPIEGHTAWVLDADLVEVAEGERGELCIGGPGLARGYRHRPDLTASRFPVHPTLGRIYRTGDLVQRTPSGDLAYLGRLDSQVKLRGYRVELEAIEATLAAHPDVLEAACTLEACDGRSILVAHLVPRPHAVLPTWDALRAHVANRLPSYMVPARFQGAAMLPRSVGGKLDRRSLPPIARSPVLHAERSSAPRFDLDRHVLECFARATGFEGAACDDDFFLALGGDSLSAVAALGLLRAHPRSVGATVRDIYACRSARGVAEAIRSREASDSPASAPALVQHATSPRVGRVEGIIVASIQAALLVALASIAGAAAWFSVFVIAARLTSSVGLLAAMLLMPLLAAAIAIIVSLVALASTLAAKWLLIGRYEAGRVAIGSTGALRYWVVERLAGFLPWNALCGTSLHASLLRALGASIGRGVHIHRGVDLSRGGWDLLTISDGVTLSQDATIGLMEFEDGHLVIAPVTIGAGATIGVRAGLAGGSSVGSDGSLAALSWLESGGAIGAGERWDGCPARRVGLTPHPPAIDRGCPRSDPVFDLLILAARLLRSIIPGLIAIALVCAVIAIHPSADDDLIGWIRTLPILPVMIVIAASIPVMLGAQAFGLRAFGRVLPGTVAATSFEAARIDAKTAAVDAAGRWLSGTLFWPLWLRAGGMRVGVGCEVSTIIDVVPETVTIGPESFFADGIYLASPRVDRGRITVAPTTLGRGSFLGNHAVIPAGHKYPEEYFVGVSTVADASHARPHSGWFGHPPMELPRREVAEVDRRWTHEPGAIRFANRLMWESGRCLLPLWPLWLAWIWIDLIARASEAVALPLLLAIVVPTVSVGASMVLALSVLLLKWGLLGRVRPGRHGLWSCWCSRWDFLYVAWTMYGRGVLGALEGTPFLVWFLRLSGMRIGRGVVLGRGFSQVVDPDMLRFEDGATVACQFQAHSFEDRVLKIDHLVIRRGANAGTNAVLFYGADIGARARVAPHTVVMKGQVIEADGRCAGSPAAPCDRSR